MSYEVKIDRVFVLNEKGIRIACFKVKGGLYGDIYSVMRAETNRKGNASGDVVTSQELRYEGFGKQNTNN